jgi:hypothetical protein
VVGAPAHIVPPGLAIGFFDVTKSISGSDTVITYTVEVSTTPDAVDVTSVLADLMSRVQPPV